MSTVIKVHASKSYSIIIEKGVLAAAGVKLREINRGQKALIVTDDIVDRLYAETVSDSLTEAGYHVLKYVIPHGEASKNTAEYLRIIDLLAGEKFARTDIVVALGGGVPGDLAGFCAATYMRGTAFCQIPTTLLAAVDSSVGGKTAVDLPQGKNLLGAFYQPDLVLCDPAVFRTLDPAVYAAGCAEIIKYGMIADTELFENLEKNDIAYASSEEVIARCISAKRDVVEQDELDTGLRKILNFGHTPAHGIENLSHYEIPHGEAVAAGMAIITRSFCEPESGAAFEERTGTEAETETEPEAEIEPEAETEVETEAETEAETGNETEIKTEAETGNETEIKTEAETGTEPEAERDTEAETEAETQTETETETQTETSQDISRRLCRLLEKYHLPVTTTFPADQLAEAMLSDKKVSGNTVDLIVVRQIGKAEIVPTPLSELSAVAARGLEQGRKQGNLQNGRWRALSCK